MYIYIYIYMGGIAYIDIDKRLHRDILALCMYVYINIYRYIISIYIYLIYVNVYIYISSQPHHSSFLHHLVLRFTKATASPTCPASCDASTLRHRRVRKPSPAG